MDKNVTGLGSSRAGGPHSWATHNGIGKHVLFLTAQESMVGCGHGAPRLQSRGVYESFHLRQGYGGQVGGTRRSSPPSPRLPPSLKLRRTSRWAPVSHSFTARQPWLPAKAGETGGVAPTVQILIRVPGGHDTDRHVHACKPGSTTRFMELSESKHFRKFVRIGLTVLCGGIALLSGIVLLHSALGLIGAFLVDPASLLSLDVSGVPLVAGLCLFFAVRGLRAAERLRGEEQGGGL